MTKSTIESKYNSKEKLNASSEYFNNNRKILKDNFVSPTVSNRNNHIQKPRSNKVSLSNFRDLYLGNIKKMNLLSNLKPSHRIHKLKKVDTVLL